MKKSMRKMIRTWKDCIDPKKVEAFARDHGVEIREGKGDHKVMKYKEQSETYYTGRELSIGVAREVWKFFVRTGLVVAAVVIAVLVWSWV